jgi:hypothetical protein
MSDDGSLAEAARAYKAAYATQYFQRDLAVAPQLYERRIALHPGAREARYSRTQIQNIADAVVPEQELLDAQIELAFAHLENQTP